MHPLNRNITELPPRRIVGEVRISSREALGDLLARAHRDKVSIYPISSGMNWEQGSRLPVHDGAIVADLSPMDRIVSLDAVRGRVIIEPGVTQQRLSEALADTPFFLPMTGSSASTSVVGNLLERGATFFGHRNDLVLGVEAMLADGRLVRTGHWHFLPDPDDASALHYARGLGPDLTHLFTQSNLGVVTRIALRLLRRPAFTSIVTAHFAEAALPAVVDALSTLLAEGVTREGTLITNANDPRTARAGDHDYRGTWFAATAVAAATRRLHDAGLDAANSALAPHGVAVTTSDLAAPAPADAHAYLPVLRDLARGVPSDYSLRTMAAMAGVVLDDPHTLDESRKIPGFSVALPAVPWQGDAVVRASACVDAVSRELGVKPFHNFASIAPDTLEGFYRIYFDREDHEDIARAHRWNELVHIALERAGFFPFRANIARMSHFVDRPADPFWSVIGDLKTTLDPDTLIAPGRYGPKARER